MGWPEHVRLEDARDRREVEAEVERVEDVSYSGGSVWRGRSAGVEEALDHGSLGVKRDVVARRRIVIAVAFGVVIDIHIVVTVVNSVLLVAVGRESRHEASQAASRRGAALVEFRRLRWILTFTAAVGVETAHGAVYFTKQARARAACVVNEESIQRDI